MSAGRGGIQEQTCESCGHLPDVLSHANAVKEYANSRSEIIEEANASSFMGLRPPRLIPYEEKAIDAMNRGAIAKRLLNLISLIVVLITLALIAATFVGAQTSDLVAYAKWLVAVLTPLLTLALGYYFGKAQQDRDRKR